MKISSKRTEVKKTLLSFHTKEYHLDSDFRMWLRIKRLKTYKTHINGLIGGNIHRKLKAFQCP